MLGAAGFGDDAFEHLHAVFEPLDVAGILRRLFRGLLGGGADLHFGERVLLFLDWALLRLHSADTVPVRPLLLCAAPIATSAVSSALRSSLG